MAWILTLATLALLTSMAVACRRAEREALLAEARPARPVLNQPRPLPRYPALAPLPQPGACGR